MEALLLKARGLPHHQIASCVGVCENTARSYFQQYQSGGIEALKRHQHVADAGISDLPIRNF